jgi:hypothetical protein
MNYFIQIKHYNIRCSDITMFTEPTEMLSGWMINIQVGSREIDLYYTECEEGDAHDDYALLKNRLCV